jgi:hypothetical protein
LFGHGKHLARFGGNPGRNVSRQSLLSSRSSTGTRGARAPQRVRPRALGLLHPSCRSL